MIEEMREALICSRIAGRSVFDLDTQGVFNFCHDRRREGIARNPDIGRIALGGKVDLGALPDLAHPSMQPVHDPLRQLDYCSAERAIRDVFVDASKRSSKDSAIVNLDHEGAVRELHDAQRRAPFERRSRVIRKGAQRQLPCPYSPFAAPKPSD